MEKSSEDKGIRLPVWFYWILAAVGCYIAYRVKEVFLPFILSFVVGYILDPFVGALEKKGIPRAHAVVRVFLIVFLLFLLFIVLIVPPVVKQVHQLEHNIGRYLAEVQREGMRQYDRQTRGQGGAQTTPSPSAAPTYMDASPSPGGSVTAPGLPLPAGVTKPDSGATDGQADAVSNGGDKKDNEFVMQASILYLGLINRYPVLKQHFGDEQALIDTIKSKQEQIGQVTLKVLSSVSNWLIGSLSHFVFVILVPIMTFYFLCVIDPLKERIMYLIKDEAHKKEVLHMSSEINVMLVRYLKGQIMVSALFGFSVMIVAYIVSFIFHTKYALLLGCIAGVMSVVPYFGMAITMTSGTLITFFTATTNPILAAIVILVTIVIVNQIFDNFISPRIVGEQVGLHPLWTLFALLAGGKLFGVMGMLIAVPIAATIKIFLIRLFPDLVEPIPESTFAPPGAKAVPESPGIDAGEASEGESLHGAGKKGEKSRDEEKGHGDAAASVMGRELDISSEEAKGKASTPSMDTEGVNDEENEKE